MDRKFMIAVLVAAAVFGGGGFGGGYMLGKSQASSGASAWRPGDGPPAGFTPGEGMPGGRMGGMRGDAGGFTAGEVISRDADGITVKARDGGSKSVILSDSTTYSKTASATVGDVVVGTQVSVQGEASGSAISARRVSIMPGAGE